jgi:hypothetical protein
VPSQAKTTDRDFGARLCIADHGYERVSMQDLLTPVPSMDEVKQKVAEAFGEVLGYEMVRVELEELRE